MQFKACHLEVLETLVLTIRPFEPWVKLHSCSCTMKRNVLHERWLLRLLEKCLPFTKCQSTINRSVIAKVRVSVRGKVRARNALELRLGCF